MKIASSLALVIATSAGLVGSCVSQTHQANRTLASHHDFLALTSRDTRLVNSALKRISQKRHPGSAVMLLEAVRFVATQRGSDGTWALLRNQTGKNFGRDIDRWYDWIWSQPYEPHPEYAQFKRGLYQRIDPRFAEYFVDTDNAKIRLDEVRWGGVVRDGIPPLKDPEMISVARAKYLSDTDVVFGVKLNGDARCYPKRILAWHEMFKDTIGGESVCGAY